MHISRLIFLFVALFLVGCAAGAASIEPPDRPPPLPTAGALAAVTISPTATPARLASPILAPTEQVPDPSPTSSPTVAPSATPVVTVFKPELGVQIHLHNEDLDLIMGQLEELGAGWVKVQVSWKLYQPEPDRYDEVLFGELDQLVAAAADAGIDVLLGVAKAPEWSRPTTEMDGPPIDPARFADFMELLARRYTGRVAAYELWNETNLQREWNGVPLDAADFVAQVRAGAAAVRAIDPATLVISGAPAPTGINDGVTAVDDRLYFAAALAAGLAAEVDGFGVHPYGWGNPAGATAANPAPLSSHNDHPSFFFIDTLTDYERILRENGVDPVLQPLWATEFGWGTTDGFGSDPVEGVEYMGYVSEGDQATYTIQAFEIGRDRAAIGPMFLWNLNFASTFGTAYAESAYSLLRPDGSYRPVFEALRGAG